MREQSTREEQVNAVSHGAGVGLALAAFAALIVPNWSVLSTRALLALGLFLVTAALLYLSSLLYHAWSSGPQKARLQLLDRTAIYGLIAGTYTPVSLLMLRGPLGWGLFVVEWLLALAGTLLLWRFRERFAGLSLWWYLLMGWLILLALGPLYRAAPSLSLWYLGAGGLAYTAGVVFFVMDARRYFHGIWHLFVLAGTALQFWGIWLAVGS
ncbi:PAQR family membrane homeostasis protein TrhA [Acidithiobacillus caldus]|jgi:hemolysin III|uniref:Predicted membrane protein hemolysin III n=4 Tax=Acidithiobacillus caldus TaxID=33059 RepID=F9ZTX5_ACICS|nr:hemolysin III family protein [Acidithiobacillus caldus]AEK59459.1 Predicted membrane protein hemolysin III [Acidithiobacillus caldus SM-1]AIA56502.1 putative membrane protein hemolysin III [Acidithiobacillus caldus ATCC 51756]AUW33823.1 hemolysin D [Acidithiobacillus caldus]MBU2730599.1 hemolysin D [Acidithiobacillus caldus]MBU2735554.1 hemolysin D [Acidithiobacillus caldus ATCC 51756]